jgi:hypothetical protein
MGKFLNFTHIQKQGKSQQYCQLQANSKPVVNIKIVWDACPEKNPWDLGG